MQGANIQRNMKTFHSMHALCCLSPPKKSAFSFHISHYLLFVCLVAGSNPNFLVNLHADILSHFKTTDTQSFLLLPPSFVTYGPEVPRTSKSGESTENRQTLCFIAQELKHTLNKEPMTTSSDKPYIFLPGI